MKSATWYVLVWGVFFLSVVEARQAETQARGAKMNNLKIELESEYEDPITGVNWLALDRQGKQMLAGNNKAEVALLDTRNLRVLKRFPMRGDRAAFILEDKFIVATYTFAKDPCVEIIDPTNDKTIFSFEGGCDIQCHSRLNLLAACGGKGEFFVYDLAKRKTVNKVKIEDSAPRMSAFSKNGILGVEPYNGKNYLLWPPPFDKEPVALPSEKFTESAAFSPDERHLALGDEDNTIDIWDIKQKVKVKTLRGPTGKGAVRALAYSPDGRFLAGLWSSSRLILWDAKEYRELGRTMTHDGFTKTLVFFPDSRRMATACNDGTVKVWKITEDQSQK
jgi:hypothetical protein